MEKVAVICSECFGSFEPGQITVVPRFRKTMNMVVAAHICSDCLEAVLEETEAYLETARFGAPYEVGYGLKYNEVIENFVGFLLRVDLFQEAIEMRYASSIEKGMECMRRMLRSIREGTPPLKLPIAG